MKLAFYELRFSSLSRFPLWIAKELSVFDDVEVVFFYEELDSNLDYDFLKGIPSKVRVSVVYLGDKTCKQAQKVLVDWKVDALVVMAQRIPDSFYVNCAKLLGARTYMFQHGLYVPFMKREKTLFITNIKKTFRYIMYAVGVGRLSGVGRMRSLLSYLKIFLKGVTPSATALSGAAVNTDVVFVYGEYWKRYHQEQFGYSYDSQKIVGAPDLFGMSINGEQPRGNTEVCYVAQTLVEDGRLPRDQMLTFLSNLKQGVESNGMVLCIKLHPRSDKTLYECFSGVRMCEDEFPRCPVYVGHYSSIISRATYITDNLIFVDFPNHEIPEYLSMLSSARVLYSDGVALSKALESTLCKGLNYERIASNIEKQRYYFDNSLESPYLLAAQEIMRD